MEILRRFAAQNGHSIPEGTRLLGGLPAGGAQQQGQQPQFRPEEVQGEVGAQQPQHQQQLREGSRCDDVQEKLVITVRQALRNPRLRLCFASLSFALFALVLAYYGASFGLQGFSGKLVVLAYTLIHPSMYSICPCTLPPQMHTRGI